MRIPNNLEYYVCMEGFEIQDGCHNCEYCYEQWHYEDEPELFCNYDKTVPFDINEYTANYDGDKKKLSDRYDIWIKWSEKHRVAQPGKCNKWRLKEYN